MWNNSKRNLISKRPTSFIRARSVIFSLIKSEAIIRSLSCKNPFCAIVKGLRVSKVSEEQIPTAMSEETTKRVNCHKNGYLPLFYIEKDTRGGFLYAPFACVLLMRIRGLAPLRRKIREAHFTQKQVFAKRCRVSARYHACDGRICGATHIR